MKKRKIGLSACSDGLHAEEREQVEELIAFLRKTGVEADPVPHMYSTVDSFSASDEERAEDLMNLYADQDISDICDISGGNLANGVLKHLDYTVIGESDKTFWGYSDLTTVINAVYALTGKSSVLYQIRNAVRSESEIQQKRISDYFAGTGSELFRIEYRFLQGSQMEGTVIGGNIRCLLKLAGTRYWPDMRGKILLLESLGGRSGQIATLFNQLDDIGVFRQVSGILLGTFSRYEKEELELSVFDLLRMHIPDSLPVARTEEIGHGDDAKAIRIGEKYRF